VGGVEAFADQLAGRQQHPGLVGRQCIQLSDQRRSLLSGHSAVQQERLWHQAIEFGLDGVKVFRALGQHQHFRALADGTSHLSSDGGSSGDIIGEGSEDVLNAGIGHHAAVVSEKSAADGVDGAAGGDRNV
jgi:hypothetical protein